MSAAKTPNGFEPWLEEKFNGSYFSLKKALEGKADVKTQTKSRPLYAAVSVRLEPRPAGFGYRLTLALKHQDVDDHDQQICIRAAFQGALDELISHHFHPIRDVEIFLTRFFYDKPQSARVVFWQAGREAVRQAMVHPGGVGMTEDDERFQLVSRG